LVIERVGNRDWKGEIRQRRGGKNLLPKEVQAERAAKAAGNGEVVVTKEELPDDGIKWGLTVAKKERREELAGEALGSEAQTPEAASAETPAAAPEPPLSDDQVALNALLGKSSIPKGPDLIIPTSTSTSATPPPPAQSETDTYRQAIASAPPVSTLEDYERVPVEEFGAALLRGMGWKGEKVAQPKEGKRRLNLLGLGAKELKGAEELGAWVQKSDVKRLNSGGNRRPERRETASQYREREDKRKRERDERYGGSGRDSGRDSEREYRSSGSRRDDRDRDYRRDDRDGDRYRDRRR
jgi:hypothetical protein